MNKKDLIDAISEKTGETKKDTSVLLEGILDTISEELANGGEIALKGFGTFKVNERAERNGRNPKTGEAIVIPASKAPVFKAGSALKKLVKEA